MEAEETVDEMEILSVELFILEFNKPNLLPALLGKDLSLLGVARPLLCCTPCSLMLISECKLEAEAEAKPRGNTGGAPLGGVLGSAVECDVSLEEEFEVRLVLPNFFDDPAPDPDPDDNVLLELFSSDIDIAFRSLFLNKLEPDL